ncbi:SGNH/GDSL hydrolase family protein [Kribbella antibiotica]|uniref:SGNH/GDSL hydrolase family protein n=1 Tax=Kribbella antibiotica TaxID=190195 RepID=UPI001404A9CE|nr:SGNH/GDSL hydrolase family protein [Kribbella antibiotica]
MTRRILISLVTLVLVTLTAAADAKPAVVAVPAGNLSVLALGDSVTSGFHCYCDAFPAAYGDQLAAQTGSGVTVHNFGVGGIDSGGLLDDLDESGSPMAQAATDADYVLLTIGANDFAGHEDDVTAGTCTTECVSEELAGLSTNLRQILDRITALDTHRTPEVLVTGYWNVFKDGQVARDEYPLEGVDATQALTKAANEVIANVAQAAHATYVDLYAPFEAAPDVTKLLAADGDHPNAAGHALIADLLLKATPPQRKLTG